MQVFALEEINVRKAINRYGTVPKGTRIGAYLDSLQQDPLTGAGEAPAEFGVCDDSVSFQGKRRPLDTTNKVNMQTSILFTIIKAVDSAKMAPKMTLHLHVSEYFSQSSKTAETAFSKESQSSSERHNPIASR